MVMCLDNECALLTGRLMGRDEGQNVNVNVNVDVLQETKSSL